MVPEANQLFMATAILTGIIGIFFVATALIAKRGLKKYQLGADMGYYPLFTRIFFSLFLIYSIVAYYLFIAALYTLYQGN